MSAIKDWAICLCFAALSTAIVQMIMPSGSTEKTMKFVIGVFFISCIVSPLFTQNDIQALKADFMQTSGEISTTRLQQEIDKQLETQIEERLKSLISQTLSQTGVKVNKIIIYMDRTEDNSISINTIDIVLDECTPAEKEMVQKTVLQSLGIMPKISLSSKQSMEVKQ